MLSKELEELITAAISDGILTSKERQTIYRRAMEEGHEKDEIEIILEARLKKIRKENSDINSENYCSHCGASVNATHMVCPSCGKEISGRGATRSLIEFQKQLSQLSDKNENELKKKRTTVIKDFPIPNTAEDLLDFMVVMSSNANSEPVGVERNAYIAKYKECCVKANAFFYNDERFKRTMETTTIKFKMRPVQWALLVCAFIFLVFVIFGFCTGWKDEAMNSICIFSGMGTVFSAFGVLMD